MGAGQCLEEGGDPVPHLAIIDPILEELAELGTRVKKMPTGEVDDARWATMIICCRATYGLCCLSEAFVWSEAFVVIRAVFWLVLATGNVLFYCSLCFVRETFGFYKRGV